MPKIGDFGLSKQKETSIHETRTKAGTPSHMAPEVWEGNMYDVFKSDVYRCVEVVL